MTTTDNELLAELGRIQRAEDAELEQSPLARLCRNELAPEERQQLTRSSDPATARAVRAFTPLDQAVKARIASRLAEVASASADGATGVSLAASHAALKALPQPKRSLPRRITLWMAPLAAAAAFLLWWTVPVGHDQTWVTYQLDIRGQAAGVRSQPQAAPLTAGATGSPMQLTANSRLELWLRPTTRAQPGAEVSARAYLAEGTALRAWPGELQADPSGALKLRLSPPPAQVERATLVVLIGRPEALAAHADEWARQSMPASHDHQRWSVPIELSPRE